MPELPEVETVCRGLATALAGRRIRTAAVNRPDLRRPLPPHLAAALAGQAVTGVARRAKYILMALEDGATLLVHLGMSGRLVLRAPMAAGRHDHLVLGLDSGVELALNDARRFGMVDLIPAGVDPATHPLLAGLGPEPLDPAFDGPALASRLAGRRTVIKAALMDQGTIAGLGNIYVCEALFRARVSPLAPAEAVAPRAARLVTAIRAVLEAAIAAGGSSLRDYVQASGALGWFQHAFAVYGREGEGCAGCDCVVAETGGVSRIVQANRSTFYCPRKQRR